MPPGFYIANNMLVNYDCFEESGECENRCVFCCERGLDETERETSPDSKTRRAGSRNRRIMLCAGEPAGIGDPAGVIRNLRKKYDGVSVTTNGRRLKDIAFAGSLVRAGLDEIFFSLHAHKAGIHDKITRTKGSFDEAVQGIKNAVRLRDSSGHDIRIAVNSILMRSNMHSLYEFMLFLRRLKVDTVNFDMLVPMGLGGKIYAKEMPSYTVILNAFNRLSGKCRRDGMLRKFRAFLGYVPFCAAGNLKDPGFSFLLTGKFNEFGNLVSDKCRRKCGSCKLNPYCEGIFEDYTKIYGLDEFRAGPGKIHA